MVQGVHLHLGAELPVFHGEAPLAAAVHEPLIERDGQLRPGGPGKAGAAGGGVRVEGELGDHQKASPHLLQVQIHLVVFILKDPQVADLLRQLVGGLLRIPGTHPQQHEKSLADLAPDLSVDGDGGMVNAGDDSAHRG